MAVVTLAVGVPEEDVAINKLARSVTEPRECPKKTILKKVAAVRIRSRWPQDCQR